MIAVFELGKYDYVHVVYSVGWTDGDWLFMVWTHEGELRIRYRFRWYVDEKRWDSEDKKNAWNATPIRGQTVAQVLETADVMFEAMQGFRGTPTHADRIVIDGDTNALVDALESMPWASVRR